MRSKKFAAVRKYYRHGLWAVAAVRNAVAKAWITAEEYGMIVGEPYEEDANGL